MFRSAMCTIWAVKGPVYSVPSDTVIADRVYSNQMPTAAVTFDFGSTDPKTLKGKGFSINGTSIEFINSDEGGSLRSGYRRYRPQEFDHTDPDQGRNFCQTQ